MPSSPSPSDDPAATLEQWNAIEQAATPGPWWSDESGDCWRLHGVAFKVPAQTFPDGEVMIPEQVMNKQILKAPKHGTPYAEYWPDEADAEFIVTARTAMPRLVAALRAVLELADNWKREAAKLEPSGADAVQPAKPGNYLVSGRIGAYEDCAGELREAITRALNGQEADHG